MQKKKQKNINNAIYTANIMNFSAHINLNSSVISTLYDVMNMCEFEMMAKAVKWLNVNSDPICSSNFA